MAADGNKTGGLTMAGIVSFGTYTPFWRLSKAMLNPKLKGERPVEGVAHGKHQG
jgi:hypothetical protein